MAFRFQCKDCRRRKVNGNWHSFYRNGKWITLCDDCYSGFPIHRKPLTAWQKKKLEFYRSEKKWHEDIEGRKILPNGDVGIFDAKGNLKEVRPSGNR